MSTIEGREREREKKIQMIDEEENFSRFRKQSEKIEN